MNRCLVVFDLEITAWPGSMERYWSGKGEYPEIVQIGAVKCDLSRGYSEQASFLRFVKPRLNPLLSDYFINLTGISQAQLDKEGISFPEALTEFLAFVGSETQAICCNGLDHRILHANCSLNEMEFPDTRMDAKFINLQDFFRKAFEMGENAPVQSWRLPELAGIQRKQARAHDALDDSRGILMVLERLSQDGIDLFASGTAT